MKTFRIIVLISLTLMMAAPAKAQLELRRTEESCYWARGRLALYQGNPSFRLWKIGTKRLLGIYSCPTAGTPANAENPDLPATVKDIFKPMENAAVGEFQICPLAPLKPGVMQQACIEDARSLHAVPWP